MRSTFAAMVAAGLVVALAGCGDGQAGVPSSAPGATTTTTTAAQPTTTTTTTSAEREVSYLRDQLCELLTPAEAQQFGSRNPRPTNSFTTGSEQCQWAGDMGLTIDFTAQSNGNLKGGKGTNTDIEVAGTPAVLNEPGESNGVCVVRIALNGGRSTMSFAASVLSSGRGKGYVPCDVAKQVAEIVIPKVKG